MNPAFSIYLDLVRFAAALLVYLYHSNQRWLVADVLPLSNFGHSSVIVFFVLSGFVIAWVTDVKESDWRSYSASRLSRVFSVVVPAVVLGLLLDGVGRAVWNVPYGRLPYDQLPVRALASLLMLNEIWFVSITNLSNVPFWSVTYEFWYYVLFALVGFLPANKGRWFALLLLVALGPKIALLAPIWALGVALYRWRALRSLSPSLSWLMVAGSTALIVMLHVNGFFDAVSARSAEIVGSRWHRELTFSKFFVADYLLGALVFVHFAGMRRVAPVLMPVLGRVARPVKWLAGYTFTLYLLHQPLFLFWGAVYRGTAKTHVSWFIVTLLTAASVWLIGLVTEGQRHRLRGWLHALLQRVGSPRRPHVPSA